MTGDLGGAKADACVGAADVANGSTATLLQSGKQRRSGRVLLVEDNLLSQRVAMAMLENLGFHVDVVADGAHAVRAAAVTRYEAILMDCQLPVLDGYEATQEIRRRQGVSRRTPVVAVTAADTASALQRCLAAGMDDLVIKPFSMKVLADVLARWTSDQAASELAAVGTETLRATDDGAVPATDLVRPTLDVRILDRLERLGRATGEDLVAQLATLFLAEVDTQLIALRRAVADADSAATTMLAHTLSGASANLGATWLAGLCERLATDGGVNDVLGRPELLEAIEAELGCVRSALDAREATP